VRAKQLSIFPTPKTPVDGLKFKFELLYLNPKSVWLVSPKNTLKFVFEVSEAKNPLLIVPFRKDIFLEFPLITPTVWISGHFNKSIDVIPVDGFTDNIPSLHNLTDWLPVPLENNTFKLLFVVVSSIIFIADAVVAVVALLAFPIKFPVKF